MHSLTDDWGNDPGPEDNHVENPQVEETAITNPENAPLEPVPLPAPADETTQPEVEKEQPKKGANNGKAVKSNG
jgi:hypothetical protein